VSLRRDEGAQLAKASLADAAHHHKVLGASERAVALALFDDARGERRPDARQLLKLFARRTVYGNQRRAFRREGGACDLRRVGRGAAGQFDARGVGRGGDAAQDDTAESLPKEDSFHV